MYYFYLDNVLMPITPSSLKMSIKNQNKTVDLASGGQLNILKTAGLTELSFDILLPVENYCFAVYDNGYKSPNYYLEHIENLKMNKKAFKFTVIRAVSATTLLKASAQLTTLSAAVLREYDLNGDGRITAADARILLKSQSGITVLNDTNMRVAIEDYTISEDVEKYGQDINVSIKLKQCPEYSLKTATYSIKK